MDDQRDWSVCSQCAGEPCAVRRADFGVYCFIHLDFIFKRHENVELQAPRNYSVFKKWDMLIVLAICAIMACIFFFRSI